MPGIAFNQDFLAFCIWKSDGEMTEEGVRAWVRQYANTQVRELLMNPNYDRTFYEGKVWEPLWLNYDPAIPDDEQGISSDPDSEFNRRAINNAYLLNKRGINPFLVAIDECRRSGIAPWLSIRMNDVHNKNDETSYMHSSFWRENPQFRRAEYRYTKTKDWSDRALDYGHEQVRARAMSLIDELLKMYDIDGLELDWMRTPPHFKPGSDIENAHLLTDFMREVREKADQTEKARGHRIRLGVRVPAHPQTSYGIGLDAVTWAKKGYVDWIVITCYNTTIDTDMPVELWKYLLRGTEVTLCAGAEIVLKSYPRTKQFQYNSLLTTRGFASSVFSRGADRVYLFNYFDTPECSICDIDNYAELFREVGDLVTLQDKPRRHIVTFEDFSPVGVPRSSILPLKVNGVSNVRIHTGKACNRVPYVILGVAQGNGKTLSVCMNGGQECTPVGPYELPCPNPGPQTFCYQFRVPTCALNDGYNVVEIGSEDEVVIDWVEIAYRAD
ncbi:MAG: hypothetical protein GXY61_14430 [Lentisphaerae bacterium]|nr:hypothetical protein [Lentisphaerota bacterium]